MKPLQFVAVILIVLGVLGLVYGGFTYITDSHKADTGPLSLSVDEKKSLTVPVWAGVGAIVLGGSLFFFAGTRRRPW